MSRQQILEAALAGGDLVDLRPLPFPGDETVVLEADDLPRRMYVSSDIMAVTTPPFADTLDDRRLGEFRAFLDDFMLGSEMSVSEQPYDKPPYTQIARVSPVDAEFWSLRINEPAETSGIRALGAFHATDEFIALRWGFREQIAHRFNEEVTETQLDWQDIFDDIPPHKGVKLNEYISENFVAV
jgi:hypothetical protein